MAAVALIIAVVLVITAAIILYAMRGCKSAADCGAGLVCKNKACIDPCADCPATTQCVNGACLPRCMSAADCRSDETCTGRGDPYDPASTGACVQVPACTTTDDCPASSDCLGGICVPTSCAYGQPCAEGSVCSYGQCLPTQTAPGVPYLKLGGATVPLCGLNVCSGSNDGVYSCNGDQCLVANNVSAPGERSWIPTMPCGNGWCRTLSELGYNAVCGGDGMCYQPAQGTPFAAPAAVSGDCVGSLAYHDGDYYIQTNDHACDLPVTSFNILQRADGSTQYQAPITTDPTRAMLYQGTPLCIGKLNNSNTPALSLWNGSSCDPIVNGYVSGLLADERV